MFTQQMLRATARGFAGQFLTRYAHEDGIMIMVAFKVVGEGVFRDNGMSGD